jgi:hypothetical protein
MPERKQRERRLALSSWSVAFGFEIVVAFQ